MPFGAKNGWYASLHQPSEALLGCLKGSTHWADDDEIDLLGQWQVIFKESSEPVNSSQGYLIKKLTGKSSEIDAKVRRKNRN